MVEGAKYKDEDWLRQQYLENGLSMAQVAEKCDCSTSGVKYWVKKHDIQTRSYSEASTDGEVSKLQDQEWIQREYTSKERSTIDIANELDVSVDCVCDYLERHSIQPRSRSEAQSDGDVDKLQDENWLRQRYAREGLSAVKVADECGVHNVTVYSWLRKHGIEVRSIAETATGEGVEYLKDKEWMETKYYDEGLSTRRIAEEVGVNVGSVRGWIDKHGIETRPSPTQKCVADLEKLNDEDYLREQYEQGLSVYDIAQQLDAHMKTVYRRFKDFGIERRGHDECHPSGPSHPQFKAKKTDNYGPNWDEQRLKARLRDHCRCQFCGINDAKHIDKYGRVNHVHHIEPRNEYFDEKGVLDYEEANRLENLITLCDSHHKKLEGVPIDNRHNEEAKPGVGP